MINFPLHGLGSDNKPETQQQSGGASQELPADMYYNYEELCSRATVTPDSEIPQNLLILSHSFGYDSRRRSNLKLLDESTLMFIAGNLLVLLDVSTRKQRYLRSFSGGGIGAMAVHPTRKFFCVAEKGAQPDIVVYEYPSLRPYRLLRGGTESEYKSVDFNLDGSLLASAGGAPDHRLTLWKWRQEKVMLVSEAMFQEVYRVSFSPYNPALLVVSGTGWGNLLLWERSTIWAEICRKEGGKCHAGTVQLFTLEDGQLMTFGSDGAIRAWDSELINSADINGDSGTFEMEPINELVVGHNVCLVSVVRSPQLDSIYFAQDSNGAIWKLDLSFSATVSSLQNRPSVPLSSACITLSDCSIFFFAVGEKYSPIGFVRVPGPVRALEWSPHSHVENRLLILCGSGDVVEVPGPDAGAPTSSKTFELHHLPRRSFRFRSIKSRIKVWKTNGQPDRCGSLEDEEEITRREAVKKEKEKEEKELPPIHIPNPPSPLCCGFYSQPGQFWLSMGGFDAGFLYHCKLSEHQEDDPLQRQDEPFAFRHVNDADDDPICSMTFSSNRQLLLCGMQSGSIRAYPLQPDDHSLTSMQAYWALSIHDNQYGHVSHVRCSVDDLFVLTGGGDGNIFCFCLLSPEEQKESLERKAQIPSPRVGLRSFICSFLPVSFEAKRDDQRRAAQLKEAERQRQLAELQRRYKKVLSVNQSLAEHIWLKAQVMFQQAHEKKEEMNQRILALRDVKVQLVAQAQHLQEVQQGRPAHLCQTPPWWPKMLPEETPEKQLQLNQASLERYQTLRAQRYGAGVDLMDGGAEGPSEKSLINQSFRKRSCSTAILQLLGFLMRHLITNHPVGIETQTGNIWLFVRTSSFFGLLSFTGSIESGGEGSLTASLILPVSASSQPKLEENKELLELKRSRITKLKETKEALTSEFKASLGEAHLFRDFLISVFRKKVQKEEEKEGDEGENDSDDDSEIFQTFSTLLKEAASSSLCSSGCNLQLFENTLQLRQRLLDVKQQLAEEERAAAALKKETNLLMRTEGADRLELLGNEKKQKIKDLDMMVPLKLKQIKFLSDGSIPSDLSEALVLDRTRQPLEVENIQLKDQQHQAQQEQKRLIVDRRDMIACIKGEIGRCFLILMPAGPLQGPPRTCSCLSIYRNGQNTVTWCFILKNYFFTKTFCFIAV
uniref:Cilia and flagella associated protein 44 n=1 Tax=Cyprinodon variegatus TaxID=28743 RepID=A0A3Q2FKH5_CYPVA